MSTQCGRNRKVRYRDELAAMIALANTARPGRSAREEWRTYRCPLCKGWHLTSQPKRQGRAS